MLIRWATSRRPRPPAVTRSAAESTPSAHGSRSSRNSAKPAQATARAATGWQQRSAMRPDHRQPRSRRPPPASRPSSEPLKRTTSWPPRTRGWQRPGAMISSCSISRPRATGQPPPQTGIEPNAPDRFSAQNEPPGVPLRCPGRTPAQNSAEHPDMREPSPTGIEPISVPNGGYRTLTAGCGSRCAIGGAGSGGTSYSWEKTHDTVGWSSGPEILPQHPCASFLGNPRHRPGRNQADPRRRGNMTQFPSGAHFASWIGPAPLSTPPSASTPTTRSRGPGTWNLFKASRRHARSPCPGGPICDSR
jgi:hypothetical protein